MERVLNNPRFVAMAILQSVAVATNGRIPLHTEALLPIDDERKYDVFLNNVLKGLSGMDENFKQQVRVILHARKVTPGSSLFRDVDAAVLERKGIRAQARENYDFARRRGLE